MRPRVGAHRIFGRLGFHEEFLIPEPVRDRDGTRQDPIIMSWPFEELWRDMEFELANGDFSAPSRAQGTGDSSALAESL